LNIDGTLANWWARRYLDGAGLAARGYFFFAVNRL
jgi:hypothetical protein